MFFVAPSYRSFKWIGTPYLKDDKYYVKIDKNGIEKEVRCYDEWQSSWPTKNKPRVEHTDKIFKAINYPDGRYSYIVGFRKNSQNVSGIWKYTNIPINRYDYTFEDNIHWSPIFSWFGYADQPPIGELGPQFIPEEELLIEKDTYKRLTSYMDEGFERASYHKI